MNWEGRRCWPQRWAGQGAVRRGSKAPRSASTQLSIREEQEGRAGSGRKLALYRNEVASIHIPSLLPREEGARFGAGMGLGGPDSQVILCPRSAIPGPSVVCFPIALLALSWCQHVVSACHVIPAVIPTQGKGKGSEGGVQWVPRALGSSGSAVADLAAPASLRLWLR